MISLGKYRHEITRDRLIVIFTAIVVLFLGYCLLGYPPAPYMYRGVVLSLFFIVLALIYWPRSKIGRTFLIIGLLLALVGPVWLAINEERLIEDFNRPGPMEIFLFPFFLVGLTIVVTRIGTAGYVMAGFFWLIIAYLFLGQNISGYFGHGGYPLDFVVHILYTDIDIGLTGTLVEVCVRLIAPFLIFASLLISSGLGQLFMAIATWFAGNMTGGPAKVSVFSSAAYGMLSGSGMADVAATGSFTIPTMKAVGYEPEQAATVETLASTGAPLMPPVMGVAAFLMTDITGIPYLQICLAAVIPVCLWYYTVFLIVHYYARRHRGKIRKWRPPKEEFMAVVRDKWHLVLAIPALIGGLVYFAAPEQGAFWAIVFLLVLTSVKKSTQLNWAKFREWMITFAKMYAPIITLIVAITIFLGGLQGCGIHTKIGTLLLGEIEAWWLILLISFGVIILLGMAVNVAATYLASIAILAPALAPLAAGNTMVWHMFIIQSAALGPITPPVALSAYVAARIAGTGMIRTAIRAAFSAIPLFLLPLAIFHKALYLGPMIQTPLIDIAEGVGILLLGVFVFTVAKEGYFFRDLNWFEKGLGIVCGIMIVQPFLEFYANVAMGAGILLLIYWFVSSFLEKRRATVSSTPRQVG